MSLDTNTWTTRSPMPGTRYNHFCAAIAGEVYVMAGNGEREEIDDVNIFNVDSGDWRIGEFLLSCLHHISNLPFVNPKITSSTFDYFTLFQEKNSQ